MQHQEHALQSLAKVLHPGVCGMISVRKCVIRMNAISTVVKCVVWIEMVEVPPCVQLNI